MTETKKKNDPPRVGFWYRVGGKVLQNVGTDWAERGMSRVDVFHADDGTEVQIPMPEWPSLAVEQLGTTGQRFAALEERIASIAPAREPSSWAPPVADLLARAEKAERELEDTKRMLALREEEAQSWAEKCGAQDTRITAVCKERDQLAMALTEVRERMQAVTSRNVPLQAIVDACKAAVAALHADLATQREASMRADEWSKFLRLLSEAGLTAPGQADASASSLPESGAQDAEDLSWAAVAIAGRVDAYEARIRADERGKALRGAAARIAACADEALTDAEQFRREGREGAAEEICALAEKVPE